MNLYFRIPNHWGFWWNPAFGSIGRGAFEICIFGRGKWRHRNVEISRNQRFGIGRCEILFGKIGQYWILRLNRLNTIVNWKQQQIASCPSHQPMFWFSILYIPTIRNTATILKSPQIFWLLVVWMIRGRLWVETCKVCVYFFKL